MRPRSLAAALFALCLAAPAAAQPRGADVVRGAVRTLAESHGPGVQDYSFTLVHASVRVPVYVERMSGEWFVRTPGDTPLADLVEVAVFWPEMSAWEETYGTAQLDSVPYVRADRVEGRPAHVVAADVGDRLPTERLDSALLFIDAQTTHVLRMAAGGVMPEGGGPFAGGQMAVRVDLMDHEATDGVVIPRRIRLRMTLASPALTATQRDEILAGMEAMRGEMQGAENPQARQMVAAMELFTRLVTEGALEMDMAVEEVLVNPGPPAWLEAEG